MNITRSVGTSVANVMEKNRPNGGIHLVGEILKIDKNSLDIHRGYG